MAESEIARAQRKSRDEWQRDKTGANPWTQERRRVASGKSSAERNYGADRQRTRQAVRAVQGTWDPSDWNGK